MPRRLLSFALYSFVVGFALVAGMFSAYLLVMWLLFRGFGGAGD